MKKAALWLAAIVITLAAAYFQRGTGPTKPVYAKFTFEGKEYQTSLPRSWETTISPDEMKGDYKLLNKELTQYIFIDSLPDHAEGVFIYKIYPGEWENDTIITFRNGSGFHITMPALPPAAKIEYSFYIKSSADTSAVLPASSVRVGEESVVLRFKGKVPMKALIPHIILMFAAMLLSNFTGLAAYAKSVNINRYALAVIITLGAGGLIFGPFVQNYAFGEFWTGWPFGGDLTDNKTLVAFVVWLAAWLFNTKKNSRRYLYIAAALVMIIIFSIPHSTAGSEYDHSKGEIVTGR